MSTPTRTRPVAGRNAVTLSALAVAVVVFITGIVVRSLTDSHAALCNSPLGQFAQDASGTAYAGCSAWTIGHTLGTVAFWLGLVGIVGLGAFYFFGPKTDSKKDGAV